MSSDEIERALRDLRIETRPELDERILADARSVLGGAAEGGVQPRHRKEWRTVMSNHWLKLAAVLAVAAAVGVGIAVFPRRAAPAYAIEQTIEANRAVRSFHVRIEPAGEGIGEAWVQLDERGDLFRMRLDFPRTEDGPKVVVWEADKAEVWFKAKKGAVVVREKSMLAQFPGMLALFDPKKAMEEAAAAIAAGKAHLESSRPSAGGDYVTLELTYPGRPEMRDFYKVDARTNLVEELERHRSDKGGADGIFHIQYLDYNRPPDPATFVLDLPPDVTRVDQTTREVGLPKGDLPDEEIAARVARAFFEALIARDYDRAGTLLEGLPASKMEELFGKIEFVRIVSIGKAAPHPDRRTRFLQVPCEVEVRSNGQTEVKTFTPNIRAVYNRPDRWTIGGGI